MSEREKVGALDQRADCLALLRVGGVGRDRYAYGPKDQRD
jgi:hypothetical protein